MSYIDFDYEKNSILICKGDSKNRKKIHLTQKFNLYSECFLENEFAGISISDFLSKLEQDGLKGELKFKELLERNNIPYLYIGQGPFGIERSGILIEKTKSKRADFLVSIKDLGTILFDVKCRNRIGFHNSKEKYFSLFTSEVEALDNLQKSILMPVWLAFTDRNTISKIKVPVFYFISISTIVKYWSGLSDYLESESDFNEIKVVRIPNSLLTKIDEKIVFEVGYLHIEDELLNRFAKMQTGFSRIVQDKIKEIIRNRNCCKTHVFEKLKDEGVDFCFPFEVESFIKQMIKNNIIDYKPKQFLKLEGE